MEKINFRAVERSTQDVPITIKRGNTERWTIQSQKTKYVNGKRSGVSEVGYTVSVDNSAYLLEEDKGNHQFYLTALVESTSGTCVLTQNESGNSINLKITTPEEEKEYWEIRFNPIAINGVDTSNLFETTTNIRGEGGSMAEGTRNKNWIVNQNRPTINVHISPLYPGNFQMLSWSCLNKAGKAFSPNYNIPDNQYFTINTTGLGSYAIRKISSPSVSNGTLILSSRFNPTRKYPLDLNFYWGKLQSKTPIEIKMISQL